MTRKIPFYALSAVVVFLYILYALINNYILDPGAETFLSYKTDLELELKPRIWLTVMYIHVAFACVAMAAGLVNFSSCTYAKRRRLHRVNGYVYMLSVLIVVLTSGYMAPYATGGKVSSMGFNLLNIYWLIATSTALIHILKKRVEKHRRWMVRSYAFCFTNMLIHLISYVTHEWLGFTYVGGYTIGVYGAIALLLVIPELIFRAGNAQDRAESNKFRI
ncbi:DUF2306 domain-containing protein [Paenibacillus soyae]|uniref:DUF2306 domain-containing protein n=1 Tax=Paenibacillus soyae TaxID=2969249 RepID=A0A9X2SAA8_9BACL|nr:DUF2306 domain-containing protein [Paenibacillus soyae]MCR2805850.1 DUF2306 domain-containing protein [Paenibacillus soyae]